MKTIIRFLITNSLLVLVFAISPIALLLLSPDGENLPEIQTNLVWLFLVSSFSVISILAVVMVVMINHGKIEFEKWKIDREQTMIREKEEAARLDYQNNLRRKNLNDSYEKAASIAKSMHESHDLIDRETGKPDIQKMKDLNQIIQEHMNLFNQQNT